MTRSSVKAYYTININSDEEVIKMAGKKKVKPPMKGKKKC